MRTYERSVRIDAPLEAVWAFHSTLDGLRALTPDWVGLRVESVERPGGVESDLVEGTLIHLSVRPFGVGPRQSVTTEITARSRDAGTARFVDETTDGPLRAWRHAHCFFADGESTILRDRVGYETVLGRVGDALAPAVLAPLFRYRHRRTRAALDGTSERTCASVDDREP